MTCIVGLVQDGVVWMGADSAGVDPGYLSMRIRADQKVFQNDDFLMGFTSSFRMGQLLRYSLDLPKRHPDTDVYKFMVTEFVEAVRRCLRDGGFAKRENEVESAGCFLVGYVGRLFIVEADYQVGETVAQYSAIGCGDEYALGSLHTSQGQPPEQRLRTALEAAEFFSAGVRGPFTILQSGAPS